MDKKRMAFEQFWAMNNPGLRQPTGEEKAWAWRVWEHLTMSTTPNYDRGFLDGIEESAQACERFAEAMEKNEPGVYERSQIKNARGLAVAIRMLRPPADGD